VTSGAIRPTPMGGQPSTDRFAELQAPAHWQAVDFISDLHLQASDAATFACWEQFLRRPTRQRADALFILGDLFEVWVGDDLLRSDGDGNDADGDDDDHFWRHCAKLLHTYSQDTPVFFMAGNRDFLLGPAGLSACGMQGLQDPTLLSFLGQRWLLSHGDALCIEDVDYMRFRTQVRDPAWQQAFLARPLPERKTIARELRAQSEARKALQANDPTLWADVDASAARGWLMRAQAHTLIHGHTHRPARHDLGHHTTDGKHLQRVVLSDWDANARPPRVETLRLDAQGLRRLPVEACGTG
jgi:UDP-2,3-diacylglucosamine hydrolase